MTSLNVLKCLDISLYNVYHCIPSNWRLSKAMLLKSYKTKSTLLGRFLTCNKQDSTTIKLSMKRVKKVLQPLGFYMLSPQKTLSKTAVRYRQVFEVLGANCAEHHNLARGLGASSSNQGNLTSVGFRDFILLWHSWFSVLNQPKCT